MVAASQLEVSLIRSWSEFRRWRDGWMRIWAADTRAEIFTHFDWLTAISQSYSDDVTPCCPVVSHSGEAIAILPVGIRNGSLNFLGNPRSDFNDLIFAVDHEHPCNDSDLKAVCRVALTALDNFSLNWQSGCLTNLVADSWLLTGLSNAVGPSSVTFPCRPLIAHHGVGPVVRLDGVSAEQLKQRLCRKKTTRRRRNQLERMGKLEFIPTLSQLELPHSREHFVKLHRERRKAVGDESFLEEASGQRFLEAILQGPSQHSARLSALRLDGQNIAMCVGLEAGGRYSYYAPTFDAEWSQYAPGDVLLSFIMEDAIDRGLSVFDFGLGDEAYKSRFATETREVFNAHLFESGVASGLKRAVLSLKESAKQNRQFYGAVKRMLSRRT
ncbi:MAG: GNAT family N-acetyltransferase [Planctomycetota bacterium]|nr:GNAT family N-acetyltransferase [Planctomycetota bacterium]